MWYLVPFLAILFLLAGLGISTVTQRAPYVGAALSLSLLFAYTMHIPYAYPVERKFQTEIEENVFRKVGLELNQLMGPQDTALLEPLGYIGFLARNKTVYDWPGLGSKIVVKAATEKAPNNFVVWGMIGVLRPNYVVLRPRELEYFRSGFPEVAALYTPVSHIQATPGLKLCEMGYCYMIVDGDFTILKRQ
jgi:hypothetical protein